MKKEWKLTSLDLFCLNMVINGAWIYKEMDGQSFSAFRHP